MKLDLSSLNRAVGSLGRAIRVASDDAKMQALDEDQRETIRAGVIQSFEYTYELCWKMLKRQLEILSASPAEIDRLSFRDLVRTGAETGLIDDPEKWFNYRGQRNITSHTYDDEKAVSVFNTARIFVHDAEQLLERLKERNASD